MKYQCDAYKPHNPFQGFHSTPSALAQPPPADASSQVCVDAKRTFSNGLLDDFSERITVVSPIDTLKGQRDTHLGGFAFRLLPIRRTQNVYISEGFPNMSISKSFLFYFFCFTYTLKTETVKAQRVTMLKMTFPVLSMTS